MHHANLTRNICFTRLCSQCRTYFCQYGTAYLQCLVGGTLQRHAELVGETPQRHDELSILYLVGGGSQERLPVEEQAENQ